MKILSVTVQDLKDDTADQLLRAGFSRDSIITTEAIPETEHERLVMALLREWWDGPSGLDQRETLFDGTIADCEPVWGSLLAEDQAALVAKVLGDPSLESQLGHLLRKG